MLQVYETSILSLNIGINFLSLAFLIVVLCSHYVKGMPSPSMRILTIGWLAGLFSMSFGIFAFSIFSLFINELNFIDDFKLGMFFRAFLLYGAFLFRFSVFGSVIERGVATFLIKQYTRDILRIVIICLYLVSYKCVNQFPL